ncbi:MAG: Gfo/Idh/MocA family oxidoreductase [Sulfuritalea sp.]|nr:Gfo/Idh/MocA family oxidoreductase [Sulfuritalea sp.]MDP1985185.1 Gfo/Idh/MocA family oxidoreductase [Sulfuritalea sp.]
MIRLGIAGMGYGANVHLPAFMDHPDVVVTALADGGSGRARKIADELGLNAQVFNRGDDLARWDGVDAVSIAVPALHQSELVRAALASGKHVLCEKPFGTGLKDISGLDRIAGENGLTTALGYEFRYDTALRGMIELVRAGRIGRVSRIDVTWLVATGLNPARTWSWRHDIDSAGGVLIDWCCHVIDYARAMTGESIRELWCSTATRVPQRPDGLGGMKPVTAPDSCDMHCIFENGTAGRFVVSNAEPAGIGHRVEVYGDKGRVRFHHAPPFTSDTRQLTLQLAGEAETEVTVADGGDSADKRVDGFRQLVADFVSAVSGKDRSPLLPSFADGEAVWRVLDAARISIAERRMVSVRN